MENELNLKTQLLPGQTLEKLSHSHKIQLIRAVKHHTLNSHCFTQIL